MELRKYIALMMEWWWLVVLAMLVSGASAYAVSASQQSVYRANARLLIDEAPGAVPTMNMPPFCWNSNWPPLMSN